MISLDLLTPNDTESDTDTDRENQTKKRVKMRDKSDSKWSIPIQIATINFNLLAVYHNFDGYNLFCSRFPKRPRNKWNQIVLIIGLIKLRKPKGEQIRWLRTNEKQDKNKWAKSNHKKKQKEKQTGIHEQKIVIQLLSNIGVDFNGDFNSVPLIINLFHVKKSYL